MENNDKVEHEKSEVVVLTTEKLLQERPPIVDEVVEFADGRKGLVKVRRGNVAEVFASFGTFTLTRELASDEAEQEGDAQKEQEPNTTMRGINVMQELVIAFMEEPKFKYKDTEGKAYPVESLTLDELTAYYNTVNKVNNPEEVDRFFDSFHEAIENAKREAITNLTGQESGKIPPPTERADTATTDN